MYSEDEYNKEYQGIPLLDYDFCAVVERQTLAFPEFYRRNSVVLAAQPIVLVNITEGRASPVSCIDEAMVA